MSIWSRGESLLRNLFRRNKVERQLDEELQAYVALLTDEKNARGMPAEEARRTALIELGGVTQVKQAVRETRAGSDLESVGQDIRFGWRMLRRSPSFTLAAVISLGLGMGATTAIFSVVYSLLIRPLEYPNARRLVWISNYWPKIHMDTVLSPDFVEMRSRTRSFEQLSAYTVGDENLTDAGEPVRVSCAWVTANFLPMLGAVPQLGRLFTASEDRPGGEQLVLISDRLWRRQFNANPGIINTSITLDGGKQTVIGVLPPHFRFPDLQLEPDVYGPQRVDPDASVSLTKRLTNLNVIGLLKTGVSDREALAEIRTFYASRAASYPPGFQSLMQGQQTRVEGLQRHLTGEDRKPLFILLGAVALVLLIACANVANLQLARAGMRRQEISVRGALGASRRRLLRQFLIESLLLAMIAAAMGLAIAWGVTAVIQHTQLPEAAQINLYTQAVPLMRLPFGKLSLAIGVDGWVLAFTLGLALVTTLLFGLLPAWRGARPDLARSLTGPAQRVTSGREQQTLRQILLVAEAGLGVSLLACAVLLTRSFLHVLETDPGFDAGHAMTGVTLLSGERYQAGEAMNRFAEQLVSRLEELPGARAAAISSILPLDPYDLRSALMIEGAPKPPMGMRPSVPVISVTPGYFRAAGTSLLEGRTFNSGDGPNLGLVAVVNRAFAARYLSGDALGKRFDLNSWEGDPRPVTIVGVAADTRHGGMEQTPQPEVYLPMAQLPQAAMKIIVRADGNVALLSRAMRNAVTATDREQPLFDVQTMEARAQASVGQRRLTTLLLMLLAMLAVLLAAVGVYGVFSYSVAQRSHEIAVRLALGSARSGVVRLVVAEAAWLVAAGGVIGLAGAFFLSGLMRSMLVGVTAHDAMSLCLAWLMMTAGGTVASYAAAAKSSRIDPNALLHAE
ncbi:MAG: ABC transporter permease [Terracidiphilus sp.]|jgi:putative ABC transport system permease protein